MSIREYGVLRTRLETTQYLSNEKHDIENMLVVGSEYVLIVATIALPEYTGIASSIHAMTSALVLTLNWKDSGSFSGLSEDL